MTDTTTEAAALKPCHAKYEFYLCGPMAGLPERNFPAFNEAAADLRHYGHVVCNPAELHGPVENLTDAERHIYLRRDITHLLECSAVLVLPGWESSAGANLEVDIAHALKIPVFDYLSNERIEADTRPTLAALRSENEALQKQVAELKAANEANCEISKLMGM